MPGGRLLQLDGVGRAGRHRVEVDIDVLRPSGQAEGHRREQPEHGARPTAHAGEEGPPHQAALAAFIFLTQIPAKEGVKCPANLKPYL